MMVFSAQLGVGGGVHALPWTLPIPSTQVTPTPLLSPAKPARDSYLYSPMLPLSPSLWSGIHTQSNKVQSTEAQFLVRDWGMELAMLSVVAWKVGKKTRRHSRLHSLVRD
jgi:hypothetical protein